MANSSGVRKTLFIGVGGSGGTTLRFLYQELLNGLLEEGWTRPLPECWQFLLIDVAGVADGIKGDVPNVLTSGASFLGLADVQTSWSTFLDMMPTQEPEVVAGWKPEAPLPGEPFDGAGQRRALGRLVAVTRIAEMKQRIDSLTLKLGSADQDLQDVAKRLGTGAELGNEDIRVYLVTSLAGGSGSGMFLDVSTVLEASGIKHINVMYTPDVFDGLATGGGNAGVVPNTLAAVSELLSAFEGAGSFSAADIAMLQRAQIAISRDGERTTDVNLIISRRGDGYELEKQNDVYHATARALAAITLDGDLNQDIEHYVLQNKESLPSARSFKYLKKIKSAASTRDELASSIGMSSISTGRAAFGQYTAERLTLFVIKKIMDSEKYVTDLQSKDKSQFENLARQFAFRAGLSTQPGQPNQIIQALSGVNGDAVASSLVEIEKQVVAQIRGPLSSGKLGVADVQSTIEQNYDSIVKTLGAQFASARGELAVNWMYDSQARLLDETVTSIVQNGMFQTTEFVKQVKADLEASIADLGAQKINLQKESQQLFDSAKQAFANVGAKLKLALEAPEVQQNLRALRNRTDRSLRIGTNNMATELIKDFLTGVIDPLIAELTISRASFMNGANSTPAVKEQIDALAKEEGAPPAHLLPPQNVIYLDSPESFKATFESQLRDVFKLPAHDENVARAAREVLANVWSGQVVADESPTEFDLKHPLYNNQQFISAKSHWKSSVATLLNPGETPTKGSYVTKRLTVDDLLAAARLWQSTRTGMHEFTTCKMDAYIYPKGQPDRTQVFLEALKRALAMSGVMAEMDHEAIQRYTGGKTTPAVHRTVNGIPLHLTDAATHLTPEAKAAIAMMMDEGFSESEATNKIGKAGDKPSVQVFTIIKEKTPPTLFKSIGEPIRQRWASVLGDNDTRDDFYELRRARPLPSFIPVADEVVVRMIKGWTIARALGLIPPADIDAFTAKNGHSAIRIFDPSAPAEDGHYWGFPSSVLRGARTMATSLEEGEVLPALLESMILGYVVINSGWLDPYARLAELGTQPQILSNWLATGEFDGTDAASPKIAPYEALTGLASREERVTAFAEYLDERLGFHASILKKEFTLENVGEADREWELRTQIQKALEELKSEVTKSDAPKSVRR
jgi:hypothetical protein